MKSYKYVMLGSGVAAGYAAQEFAQQKVEKGALGIVTADEAIPYDRPPLSKKFLAGKATRQDIVINDAAFYRTHSIDVLVKHPVIAIDLSRKKLRCQPGGDVKFEKLLIATGSSVCRLPVPGADLEGVHYLRSRRDSEAIRRRIKKGKQAVVIGSGFIGMEVAAVLAEAGVDTAMIFRGERIWQKFFTPELSDYFSRYYAKRGIRLLPNQEVAAVHGKKTVSEVELKTGERLPADLVIVGIGVEPATGLFANTELKLNQGIVVDEFLQTSVPGIWAAGDVANYPDKIFNKRRRIAHWDNAVEQGRVAVRNMMARPQPFVHVPYFFSNEFDLSWEFWGDTEQHDQIVYRGDINRGKFSVWWLLQRRLMAAFVLNRPNEERELAPKWIMQREILSPKRLRMRQLQ
jgi:NADPH-dependent 2,4-dienoyl-CoA reductase/sulfur reductase-like enzyme